MHKLRHLLTAVLLTATILISCALAQTNLTQIRDTINNANGTPFNGTIVITFNGSSSTLSGTVSPLSTSARIYNGALSVLLVPTTTVGGNAYYQVVYSSSDGTTQWTETWQVPPSSNALSVSGVRTSSTTGSGGTGTGGTGGTGTGSPQYATLPIALNQVTGLNSALSSLGASISTNASAITTLQSNVTALQTSSAALSSTTTGLQNSFATLNSTVTGVQNSIGSLNTTVGGLQTSLGTANSSISGLQTSLGSLNSTVTGLQTSYGTLNTSVTGLQSSVTALNSTTSGLQNSLTTVTNNVGSLQTSNSTLNQTVGGIQSSVTSLNNSVGSLQSSVNTLTPSVSGLQTSLASLTTSVNGLLTSNPAGLPTAFVDAEVPTGTVDGTNATFTLANPPVPMASLALYRNGILQKPSIDFTLSGTTVTFTATVPKTGDLLQAYYRRAGTNPATTFVDGETPAGSINGTNAAFTLAFAPNPVNSLQLFNNGILMRQGADYTLSGSVITFVSAAIPQSNDMLTASYRR